MWETQTAGGVGIASTTYVKNIIRNNNVKVGIARFLHINLIIPGPSKQWQIDL